MDLPEWHDKISKLDQLQKFTKPPRYPTKAESYLENFWIPAVGHVIFSPEEAPGEEYQILFLNKKHPEQAKIKNIDNQFEIVYLQDWHWAPREKDLDEILKKFGVRILGDCVMRNRITLAKPKTPEEYVKVLREIRKYSMVDGIDYISQYHQGG